MSPAELLTVWVVSLCRSGESEAHPGAPGLPFELLVSADGSSNGTAHLLARLAHADGRILSRRLARVGADTVQAGSPRLRPVFDPADAAHRGIGDAVRILASRANCSVCRTFLAGVG